MFNNAKAPCLEYGFKESTESFASCIQKEINETNNRAALESASKEIKKDSLVMSLSNSK